MTTTAMERHEYRTVEKSAWGAGPWQNEPDKVQWVDEATGLDCLIVRNSGGALCGYVGVSEGHRYFRIGYSDCATQCGTDYCSHSPGSVLEVHGGLTFSDACHEPTREAWERWCVRMVESEAEAAKYPKGDAAEKIGKLGHLRSDYDAWRAYGESSFICHMPLAGRPDNVWWLGFDCAHSGDLSPRWANDPRFGRDTGFGGETYKSLSYVTQQCADLAQQLVPSSPS